VPRSIFTAVVLVLAVTDAYASDPDFSGTYAVTSLYGDMTLTLEQSPDGATSGALLMPAGAGTCPVSGRAVADEEGEWSVEGSIQCADGRSDFEFAEDEDGEFVLLLVPYDKNGEPRSDLAAVYYARRATAGESPTGGTDTPDPPTSGRDPDLVGLWATQVVMSTSSGSMTTLIMMEIRANGTLIDLGSRSVGGIPGVGGDTGLQGGGDVADWQTSGNVLQVRYAGSQWVALATYQVSGDQVLFAYYDGDRKVWYRR